jgi:hypothetical protein
MIDNILADADPDNPPVIIIQSDHGARNIKVGKPGGLSLDDYPMEFSTHILNLMYIPGYDMSQIPQDINPINTFPIVFNFLFHTDIPLR